MRKLTIIVIILAILTAGILIGRIALMPKNARASNGGPAVTVVSDQQNIVQIIDTDRRVVCYCRSTPAGSGISCVKY